MASVKGTHTEILRIPGGVAIASGVPDKCDHDDNESVFTLANGEFLFEKDYRCPTSEATLEYVSKVANDRNTTINGGTCGCSKCGKVHSLGDLMGEAYWV